MDFNMSLPTPATSALVLLLVSTAVCLYLAALPRPIPGIPHHKRSALHPLGDTLDFLAHGTREGDMLGLLPLRLGALNSPIMQVFLRPLGRPWVVVSDPQETYDILTRRTREFDRSDLFRDLFQSLLPHNHMHLPTGPEWAANRRLINGSMSSAFLHGVAGPRFWTTAQEMIRLWRIKARLAQGRPFSVAADVYGSALKVVWHVAFGSEAGSIKAQIKLLKTYSSSRVGGSVDTAVDFPRAKDPPAFQSILMLTESLDIPINSIIPRIHHFLALKLYPKLVVSSRCKDAFIKDKLEIAKERVSGLSQGDLGDEDHTSVIDLMVHRERVLAAKEEREPAYSSKVMSDELFGLLFAGHETTSTTLCWAIKFLSAEQKVQNKLRKTLQAVFADAYAVGNQPSIQDITSHDVPYLDAVIAEIHRKAMTTVAVSRKALVDTTILGHHIPKGTDVLFLNNGPGTQSPAILADDSCRSKTSLQTMMKHPGWDPENIEQFIPERWLRVRTDGSEEFNPQAGPSGHFGAGPRACFGRKWAQLELRVILTLILWNFELQQPPPELASFRAVDRITHQPQKCYVRLVEIGTQA